VKNHQLLSDPFAPLYGGGPGDEPSPLHIDLFDQYYFLESFGNEHDWREKLDWATHQIKTNAIAWYGVGLIAWKIKLQKAWKGKFGSFRDFCENAIGKTASCINNWIRAARVISILLAANCDRIPLSASVALELSKLEEPESIEDVWRDLCDRYQSHQITAQIVRESVRDPFGEEPKIRRVPITVDNYETLREIAANAATSPARLLNNIIRGWKGERLSTAEEDREAGEAEPVGNQNPQGRDDSSSFALEETGGESDCGDTDAPGQRFESDHQGKDPQVFAIEQKPVICAAPYCGEDHGLIAIFNARSFLPDFYLCPDHALNTPYCLSCGHANCVCEEVSDAEKG
jgi:hypothetical protein